MLCIFLRSLLDHESRFETTSIPRLELVTVERYKKCAISPRSSVNIKVMSLMFFSTLTLPLTASANEGPVEASGSTTLPDPEILEKTRSKDRKLWVGFGLSGATLSVGVATLTAALLVKCSENEDCHPPPSLYAGSVLIPIGAAGVITFGILVRKHRKRWPHLRRRLGKHVRLNHSTITVLF